MTVNVIPLDKYTVECVNIKKCVRNRFNTSRYHFFTTCDKEPCFFLSKDRNNCRYDIVDIENTHGSYRSERDFTEYYWRQFVCIGCGSIVHEENAYSGTLYLHEFAKTYTCKKCGRHYVVLNKSNFDIIKYATEPIE